MYLQENIKLTDDQKRKLVDNCNETFEFYRTQLEVPRQRMLELFEATFIFKFDRGNGKSALCFPKLWEHLQKIAPRLVSNDPKWVLTPLAPSRILDDLDAITEEDKEQMFVQAQLGQLYLNYIWWLGRGKDKLDEWSISGLALDIGWAKVDFYQELAKKKEYEVDEIGTETEIEVETVKIEYPTFEIVDSLSVYFDPRVSSVDDMRSIITYDDSVSVSDLMRNKNLYYKEAIEWLENVGESSNDFDSKVTEKFTQQGVPYQKNPVDKTVSLKTYYGYVCLEEEEDGQKSYDDEIMVMYTVANETEVIECKTIPFMPFEKFTPSKVPNQAIGRGALSPILDQHKAYNLIRNQRFDNVNIIINRMWWMRRGAAIDPKKFRSVAGNVIDSASFDDFRPIDTPDVTRSSYEEANSLNTEMQATTGTIDTAQDAGANGFTNFATGQKIRWAEFNSRFKYYKDNLEYSLARLGRKMLMMTAERASKDPVVLDRATNRFYKIAKEMFDNYDDFFDISVLADSTSYDSVSNQREEALAKAEIAKQYKQAGVNVDLTKNFIDIMNTFPGTDGSSLVLPTPPPEQTPVAGATQKQMADTLPPLTEAEQLTQSITGGL
jgi:hypothetical protein